MTIQVKVTVRDKVGKDFRTVEKMRIQQMMEKDTRLLAEVTEQVIQETIMRKTEMPTGKLASNFLAEPIVGGWGVGDIAQLDSNVPYWNHIDKGSKGIGANWQHFLPKGFWFQGRWVSDPTGYSGIKPNTPIEAVNYIASTLAEMEIRIPSLLKKVK